MPYGHVYFLRHSATISTAITAMQIGTPAGGPCVILSASASQRGSTTSAQEELSFTRKSAGATVTAASVGTHLFKKSAGDPTPSLTLSTTTTGVVATAEGTDTDIAFREGFNVLNGWKYLPVPDERIFMGVSAFLGLKFATAPASQNWDFNISLMELGS